MGPVSHRNTQKPQSHEDLAFNPRNRLLTPEGAAAIFRAASMPEEHWPDLADPEVLETLRLAFVHRSYTLPVNADHATGNALCPPGTVPLQPLSYDELEFNGDKFFNHFTQRYITRRFAGALWARNEGNLTRLVSRVVCRQGLSRIGRALGLGQWLLVSRHREEAGARESDALVEDAFEALVGALDRVGSRGREIWEMPETACRFAHAVLDTMVDWPALVSDLRTKHGINERERLGAYLTASGERLVFRDEHHARLVRLRPGTRTEEVVATGRGDTVEAAREAAAARANRVLSEA